LKAEDDDEQDDESAGNAADEKDHSISSALDSNSSVDWTSSISGRDQRTSEGSCNCVQDFIPRKSLCTTRPDEGEAKPGEPQ
jgi:hypothetical protein